MRTNIVVFTALAVFFYVVSAAYTLWNLLTLGHVEWMGTTTLFLTGIFTTFVGFFLSRTHGAQGGELPEDRPTANIDDGDPELGHFSPWSWWPFTLAAAIAIVFLGIAVGPWICFIGAPLVAIALVGWVYEYYRGNFSR